MSKRGPPEKRSPMTTTKESPKNAGNGKSAKAQAPESRSRDECLTAGKALRETLPRRAPCRVEAVAPSDAIPSRSWKIPIGIGFPNWFPSAMGACCAVRSPFCAAPRGSMACDLATTPTTGLRVQACGDCHLLNFGLFATPERNLVFDLNDFDETLPAPWEWDVKRLGVSFAVAARDNDHSDEDARDAAVECVRAYREKLRDCSKMSPLDVWYDRLDIRDPDLRRAPDAEATKAPEGNGRAGAQAYRRISVSEDQRRGRWTAPPAGSATDPASMWTRESTTR